VQALAPPAALYVAVLRVHPFIDGNLRAAFVALQVALRSIGLPGVAFVRVRERHDEAIGWAVRGDEAQALDPLVALLLDPMAEG